jgi:NAD(P)-dependent dehydrogenase (short-subunit alcohol dehydrogenase family)
MNQPARLQGKVAIVTGAASGIAKATAQRFLAEGAHVTALDVNTPLLEQFQSEDKSGRLKTASCDIAREDSVKAVFERTLKEQGRIDILANVAGVTAPRLLVEEMPLEEFQRVLSVNLIGTFLCIKHAAPAMKKQRYGRIVNVASISGYRPTINTNVAYTASKGGIIALSRQLVKELSPYGITINSVAPGVIQTPLTEGVAQVEGGVARRARFVPLGRIAQPQEVAAAMAFLASHEGGYINGEMLVIDGGMTAIVGYSGESAPAN